VTLSVGACDTVSGPVTLSVGACDTVSGPVTLYAIQFVVHPRINLMTKY